MQICVIAACGTRVPYSSAFVLRENNYFHTITYM